MADKDQSGDLSFAEFNQIPNDTKIQEIYRAIIDRHRGEQEKIFGQGRTKTYLPFDLTKLIENFAYQGRRDHVEDSSTDRHPSSVSKTYVKLFLLGHDHNSTQPSHMSQEYENTILGKLNQHKVNYMSTTIPVPHECNDITTRD